MGSYTPLLVAPLGIRLPVYPIKGYSLTVPITDASVAPLSTVMDETHKVAVTRLGDRIRVGGTVRLLHGFTTAAEVRMIGAQIGGSLEVSSNSGKGTTVGATLPLRNA